MRKWILPLLVMVTLLMLSLIVPSAYAKDINPPSPSPAGLLAGETEPKSDPADLEAKLPPELQAQVAALKATIEEVNKGDNYIKAERLVVSKSGVSASQLDTAIAKVKPTEIKEITRLGKGSDEKIIKLVKFASEAEAAKAVKKLSKDPNVLYVAKNIKFSVPEPIEYPNMEVASSESESAEVNAEAVTADPMRSSQWALDKIKDNLSPPETIPAPWVAVIDSGVQYDHPDLSGQVVLGYDYVNDDYDPMDDYGHGTHVSGIIAAKVNNGQGVAGISPKSKVYAVKVLDAYGSGTFDDVIAGMCEAAVQADVKILNLSFISYVEYLSPEYLLCRDLINDIKDIGKIVVSAAGNESNLIQYQLDNLSTTGYDIVPVPATLPKSFTVAATDWYDYRAYFSNYSSSTGNKTYNYVDIAAPGLSIYSTYIDSSYAYMSGTSMSAPMVSATLARVWAAHPFWTESQVTNRLKNTGIGLGAARGFPVLVKRIDILKALGGVATGIQGQVINADTGSPLPGAQIKVGSKTTYANNEGFFTLTGVSAGTKKATATKRGFVSLTKSANVKANLITDDVNFYLTTIQPSDTYTAVVEWGSTSPGFYEWTYSSLEHPHLPDWTATAGSEMNTYFKIMPDNVVISPDNLGDLSNPPYAQLIFGYRGLVRPVRTLRYKATTDRSYLFAEGMSPYDFCWGNVTSSKAVARIYSASSLIKTIFSKKSTGTADFWWQAFQQNGTANPTVSNLRAPLLGVVTIPDATVILVDDDEGASYNMLYMQALSDADIAFSYWNIYNAGSPSTGDLAGYGIVIWETGNSVSRTLTRYERTTVSGHLAAGRRLFLSGQDIGYDLNTVFPTPESKDFYNAWLKANYLVDWAGMGLIGVPGDPISDPYGPPDGNELAIAISDGTGADNQNWPDGIEPLSPATTVFTYFDGNGNPTSYYGAIKAKVTVGAATYKLVYLSFGFEGISDTGDRALLMQKIIKWLTP